MLIWSFLHIYGSSNYFVHYVFLLGVYIGQNLGALFSMLFFYSTPKSNFLFLKNSIFTLH